MYRYKKSEKIRLRRIMIIFGIMILTSILSISLYRIYEGIEIDTYGNMQNSNIQAIRTIKTVDEVKEHSKQIADVVEEVTSCVVGISKIKDAGNTVLLADGTTKLGLGTGVIVTENGYILSNEHVTGAKYSNCYVTLENGRTYTANVVWSDSNIDLSISKVNIKNLPYAKLGDSENIRTGETVYAIGNPIGYEFQRTVTSGIISAINRTIKIEETIPVGTGNTKVGTNENTNGNVTSAQNVISGGNSVQEGDTIPASSKNSETKTTYMEDLIQTDATINPGNSGGPLINADGNIIGITTVKITSAEGIGFAVPINIVKPIIERYQKEGKFEEAKLGIFAYDKEMIPYIDSKAEQNKGIYIAQISLDSAASKTGLKVGDIITKIDELELSKMSDLRSYIYTKSPGDTVTLTIYRNNKEAKVNVQLSAG